MENLEAMRAEWEAWLKTNDALLKETGWGWDDVPELHASIVLWGERLAALRVTQEPDVLTEATDEAERKLRRVLA